MNEKILQNEGVRSVPALAERFIATLERGGVIEGNDIVPEDKIRETFAYLCEVHEWMGDERILDVPPTELAAVMRQIKKTCNELEEPVRAFALGGVVAELALMDAESEGLRSSFAYRESDRRLNDRLPADWDMPDARNEVVRLLSAATYEAAAHFSVNFGEGVDKTVEAVTALCNSSYGKNLQRTLLEFIRAGEPSEETLFKAYLTVTPKARLSGENNLSEQYSQAFGAVDAITREESAIGKFKFRTGNYTRGVNDVLGAALLLRDRLPGLSAEECITALFANATTIGSMTERLTAANPLDHDGFDHRNDHDIKRLASIVRSPGYDAVKTEDGVPPVLVIPEGSVGEDEFPDFIFSKDSEVRRKQEEKISKQRMNSGRCPVRNPVELPDGKILTEIIRFDAEIKSRYQVDPGILMNNNIVNPAALMIARVIEVGAPTGLWTHELKEYDMPATYDDHTL